MKAKSISISDLLDTGKWRADLYVHEETELSSERFKLVRLADVVTESKIARDPADLPADGFFYIGLEHVEQIIGEPINVTITNSEQVKSRSKTFESGDVLYGRLRPYLRKAIFVEPPYDNGLCSPEFIVLKPKKQIILPLFLREVLVSEKVTELVSRLQGGAALPRISSKDLLNISIPLPPIEFQEECVKKIEQLRSQRRELLSKANKATKEGQNIISEIFS